MAVQSSYGLAIYCTYFIQFYVPMTIVIPWIRSRCSVKVAPIADAATRTLFVVFTCKYAIPHVYCRQGRRENSEAPGQKR